MGFFNKVFGNSEKEEKAALPWQSLNEVSQIESISKKSFDKPQFIFKHSTTCGVSRMVLNIFKSSYNLTEEEADLYYLEIQSNRDVSRETGYFFQVIHESPQLLVIKNGEVVSHASHNSITNVDFEKFV